jgi:hypothetical protein
MVQQTGSEPMPDREMPDAPTPPQRILVDLYEPLPEREVNAMAAGLSIEAVKPVVEIVNALLDAKGEIVELATLDEVLRAYAAARQRVISEPAVLDKAVHREAFFPAAITIHGLLTAGTPATKAWIRAWLEAEEIMPGEKRRRPS